MPQPNDLATLQSVKQWIMGTGVNSPWVSVDSDPVLGTYISAASRAVHAALQRGNLLYRTVNEMRNGTNTQALVLREYPAISITSLTVGSIVVPARPPLVGPGSTPLVTTFGGVGPSGYVLEPWDGVPPGSPQTLRMSGYSFAKGSVNVNITYTAGYAILSEVQQVPAADPYMIRPSEMWGRWAQDIGVTYADSTPLVKVAATPALGQYVSPPAAPATLSSPDAWNRVYSFNAADAGRTVLLSYSYVPNDLEQAVTKWVGEWWAYKMRPGERSRALPGGGGTASFDLAAMPDDVKMMLQPYKRAVPIPI